MPIHEAKLKGMTATHTYYTEAQTVQSALIKHALFAWQTLSGFSAPVYYGNS